MFRKNSLLFILLFSFSSFTLAASTIQTFNVDLDDVKVSELVRVVYGDVLKTSYVFEPDFQESNDLVSVHLHGFAAENLAPAVAGLLIQRGYSVVYNGGVYSVHKLLPRADDRVLVYHPRYRSAAYLSNLISLMTNALSLNHRGISPLAAGGETAATVQSGQNGSGFSGQQNQQQNTPNVQQGSGSQMQGSGTSASALIDSAFDDQVVLNVEGRYYDKVLDLLNSLDSPVRVATVRASVYEVDTTNSKGSGVALAGSLFGGHIATNLGGQSIVGADTLTLGVGQLTLATATLDGDTRFKSLGKPAVLVRSGQQSSITVGQSVPVLGSVTLAGNGTSQQSVSYTPSGITFIVKPDIHSGSVDLDLTATVSSFVATTTGVNNSPTLQQRSLVSSLTVKNHESILIGGLESEQENGSSSRSFFHVFDNKQNSGSKSSIVILLQVDVSQ